MFRADHLGLDSLSEGLVLEKTESLSQQPSRVDVCIHTYMYICICMPRHLEGGVMALRECGKLWRG